MNLTVHIGAKALDWDEYEAIRESGRPCIIQISYVPIAGSMFDAGRGFKGGHAMAETQHSTIDSLADGRAHGVWRYDGRLYPRNLMRQAAGELLIAPGTHVGLGKVWAAVGRDTAADYTAKVTPLAGHAQRHYRDFRIVGGKITGYRGRVTKGFHVRTSVPRGFKDSTGRYQFLVEIEEGTRRGQMIAQHWAKETP